MTLELLEGALDDLSAYVQANMAAKVATLNARYGDTLLSNVAAYYDGNLPLSTPETPSIAFHGEGFTAREQHAANVHMSASVNVAIFVGDDNVENRFRKLCRYALGVVELLRTAEGSMSYTVKLRGPVTLTEPLNVQPFLQGIIVPVALERAEDY
jgi:hypothetical protein